LVILDLKAQDGSSSGWKGGWSCRKTTPVTRLSNTWNLITNYNHESYISQTFAFVTTPKGRVSWWALSLCGRAPSADPQLLSSRNRRYLAIPLGHRQRPNSCPRYGLPDHARTVRREDRRQGLFRRLLLRARLDSSVGSRKRQGGPVRPRLRHRIALAVS